MQMTGPPVSADQDITNNTASVLLTKVKSVAEKGKSFYVLTASFLSISIKSQRLSSRAIR